MPQFDVMTFGETMLRLSPPSHGRIENTDTLDCRTGGSESNTAVALARLGRRVTWWSRLPNNSLGRKVSGQLNRWGVDTSKVIWSDEGRLGLYFVEFGSPPRPTIVTYDRTNSAVSYLKPDDVDWAILSDAAHLHVTGITCALSPNCAETVLHAVKEAKSRGLSVSFDVNYRSKLWSAKRCRDTISRMMPYVDLLFCPMGDADNVFGIKDSPGLVARRLQGQLRVDTVVVTGSSDHVAAVQGRDLLRSDIVRCREVDRVGAGDAGDAGIIHGFLDGDLQKGLKYGSAMAALKQTIPGDELIVSKAEIEAVVNGGSSGIQR
ncbi:MAG: sugar kinase [Chthonomonadales bacterium]